MREIATEIYIESTPERVWRALTDFERYPQWNPFIRAVKRNELAPGARLKVTIQMPDGGAQSFRPVLVKVVPASELRWRGHLGIRGLFDGEHAFLMEPRRTGTQFFHRERFSGLFAPLLMPFITARTRRGFEAMNQGLKRVAEAKS